MRASWDARETASVIRNWERGLLKPQPTMADVDSLAKTLGVERQDLLVWKATHKYAPIAPTSVGLPAKSTTASWVDYDNDGPSDLYTVPPGLFKQSKDPRYEPTGLLSISNEQYLADAYNWFALPNNAR